MNTEKVAGKFDQVAGKIKQGVPVTYDFAFKNVSKQPVVIESATASCGCTTPVKPEKPFPAGKPMMNKASLFFP